MAALNLSKITTEKAWIEVTGTVKDKKLRCQILERLSQKKEG